MLSQNETKKTKRTRIKATLPQYTQNIDYRINQVKAELGKGLTKFELKWLLIQNEVKTLNY